MNKQKNKKYNTLKSATIISTILILAMGFVIASLNVDLIPEEFGEEMTEEQFAELEANYTEIIYNFTLEDEALLKQIEQEILEEQMNSLESIEQEVFDEMLLQEEIFESEMNNLFEVNPRYNTLGGSEPWLE